VSALLLNEGGVEVWHADWRVLLEIVRERGGADALIVDAPYSERTHSGHDDGAVDANRGADMAARIEAGSRRVAHRPAKKGLRTVAGYGVAPRRSIDYAAWTDDDVDAFVDSWTPLVRGWCVSITDHVLARAWESAFTVNDRYPFAPLPLYSPGSRVRLSGDGPSSWTCQIVVARPRTREFFQWGTLPGGYVCAPERMPVVGGKPLAAMREIVRDYSRPGDLIVDPCCGGGTTALAARLEGRRAIVGDAMREHAEIAAERLRAVPLAAAKNGTLALFASGGPSR
jgi:site-specific DNA-methyltransferase (adenine-specific)